MIKRHEVFDNNLKILRSREKIMEKSVKENWQPVFELPHKFSNTFCLLLLFLPISLNQSLNIVYWLKR